jgi:hypothetical protein
MQGEADDPLPFIDTGLKRAARNEQEHWEGVTEKLQAFTWIEPATSLVGAPPSMYLVGVCVTAALWVCGRRKVRSARKIADDPPRLDFHRDTYLLKRPFHPEAFGTSRLGESGAAAVESLLTSSDLDLAFVRAVERLEGARERNASDFLGARAEEATRFAHQNADTRERLAGNVRAAADALRDFQSTASGLVRVAAPRDRIVAEMPVGRDRLLDALPDSAIGLLVRAGFDRSDLDQEVERTITIGEEAVSVHDDLISAAGASEALGSEFRRVVLDDEARFY